MSLLVGQEHELTTNEKLPQLSWNTYFAMFLKYIFCNVHAFAKQTRNNVNSMAYFLRDAVGKSKRSGIERMAARARNQSSQSREERWPASQGASTRLNDQTIIRTRQPGLGWGGKTLSAKARTSPRITQTASIVFFYNTIISFVLRLCKLCTHAQKKCLFGG